MTIDDVIFAVEQGADPEKTFERYRRQAVEVVTACCVELKDYPSHDERDRAVDKLIDCLGGPDVRREIDRRLAEKVSSRELRVASIHQPSDVVAAADAEPAFNPNL